MLRALTCSSLISAVLTLVEMVLSSTYWPVLRSVALPAQPASTTMIAADNEKVLSQLMLFIVFSPASFKGLVRDRDAVCDGRCPSRSNAASISTVFARRRLRLPQGHSRFPQRHFCIRHATRAGDKKQVVTVCVRVSSM